MMKEIVLDKVIRSIGNRTDGVIRYGQKADGSHFEIPVIIIKGKESGPTLLVDGCTHGDEFEGTEAILKIAKEYESGDFAGVFVGVPALNMEAFMFNSRNTLTDWANLNRVFPGNPDLYITNRLAAVYVERILKNVDALVSFHGGGTVLHLEGLGCYFPGGELGKKSKEMAEAFNLKYINLVTPELNSGWTAHACIELGIPCLVPEVGSQCGRLYNRERDIDINYRGIKNIMIYFGMLNEKPPERVEQVHIEVRSLHSYNGGIQKIVKKANEIIEEGELIGVIYDIFGNVVEEMRAPWKGVIVGFWSVPVIKPGDWWFFFGKILDE